MCRPQPPTRPDGGGEPSCAKPVPRSVTEIRSRSPIHRDSSVIASPGRVSEWRTALVTSSETTSSETTHGPSQRSRSDVARVRGGLGAGRDRDVHGAALAVDGEGRGHASGRGERKRSLNGGFPVWRRLNRAVDTQLARRARH